MMTQERFETLADAFGGDMARWPEAERAAAQAYAETYAARADTVLKAAQALDALLETAPEAGPSSELFNRIVAQGVATRRPAAPTWAAAAAAVMMTIGLGTGWLAAAHTSDADDEVFAAAFGALDEVDVFEFEEDAR